jgi:hypothetical protein
MNSLNNGATTAQMTGLMFGGFNSLSGAARTLTHPPGPRAPAECLAPFTLLPGQAADMILVWLWQGEPFGALGIGDYRYNLQF